MQAMSPESLIAALETDALTVTRLIQDALDANTLDRIQSVLYLWETRIYDELTTARLLWPCQQWDESQRACRWIHSASLAIQMAYRHAIRSPQQER